MVSAIRTRAVALLAALALPAGVLAMAPVGPASAKPAAAKPASAKPAAAKPAAAKPAAAMADFLKKGASATGNGLLTQAPPNTGAGWYSLATGAWPGVTGSTNNTGHVN